MKYMIVGACGHMGRILTELIAARLPDTDILPVDAHPDCEDVYRSPADYPGKPDIIIDFSHHSATEAVTDYAVQTRTPLLIAATGQSAEELAMIRAAAERVPIFLASNFSLGIAVLVRIAKQAAAAFPDADIEIVEAHHNRKLDVPSGTALTLAKALQSVRRGATLNIGRPENGKRSKEEIGVHSLRMGNVAGIHEVHIVTETQSLTLKHEAYDRRLFAEGALDAAKFLLDKPAGLYGMEQLLEEKL